MLNFHTLSYDNFSGVDRRIQQKLDCGRNYRLCGNYRAKLALVIKKRHGLLEIWPIEIL